MKSEQAWRILVIEDDTSIRSSMRAAFESEGALVFEAATARHAHELARDVRPSLIVLDLGLPDADGADVCRALRAWSAVPILVLSARHELTVKAALLDDGADDYLTKPFSTLELLARTRALIRRATMRPVPGGDAPILHDGLRIDLAARRVERDGETVHLTPTEWSLLAALVRHAGRPCTHTQLFDAVWSRSHGDAQQYLRVYVAHLRRKLERDPLRPRLILTEPGAGIASSGGPASRTRAVRNESRAWRARWLGALGALALVTGGLLFVRAALEPVHVTLAYLLLVLVVTTNAGGRVGAMIALVSFVAFNLLFLPPYYTLALDDPRDWIVLIAFLTTALVAARLLDRAQRAARAAAQRAAEIDSLARLGAESIGAARADDAIRAVETAATKTLAASTCRIVASIGSEPVSPTEPRESSRHALRHIVCARGVVGILDHGGITQLRSPAEFGSDDELPRAIVRLVVFPLSSEDRVVGTLEVEYGAPTPLDGTLRRLVPALAYYARLALDRAQLASAAEREAAEREATRLRELVVAAVSHDLRTPLTAIRATAAHIANDSDTRGVQIMEEVDRLDRLVADVLDLSRLRANALPVRATVSAVEDVLGVLLDRTASIMPERDVHVTLDTSQPLLLGLYDESHMLRILTNLVENAARHAPPATAIELEAAREGDTLVVHVRDRGPGVPTALQARLFEPFVSGDGAGPRNAGLGLAVAAGLASAMHGSLSHTPREGGGSIFTVRLPAAEWTPSEAPPVD